MRPLMLLALAVLAASAWSQSASLSGFSDRGVFIWYANEERIGRLSIAHGEDFGPAASIDLQRDYLRWFDYWLKGMDNGVLKDPLVSLFVMGSNHWLYGPAYPLPQTRFENLYLADGGRLSFTAPNGPQSEDRYTYDPGNPTPPPDTG